MRKVVVQSLPDKQYAVLASDGRHAFVLDESKEDGGDDLGPAPHEAVLAALGACTAITLRMYADRKQWPLYEVSVHLTHEKVRVEDCGECTDEDVRLANQDGRIDVIHTDISVRGDLDQAQVDRLLEIAQRCPVHRTLMGRPKIVSTITAGP